MTRSQMLSERHVSSIIKRNFGTTDKSVSKHGQSPSLITQNGKSDPKIGKTDPHFENTELAQVSWLVSKLDNVPVVTLT